jgi:hypothetical protein
VALSGKTTVQYQGNSGDYDYLLFVPGGPLPPKFSSIQASGANLIITWTGGTTLQSATSLSGPWTTVTGATSPATVPKPTTRTFFRVQQ